MQIVLIILSVGLLGVIIYFAVSHKSSRLVRLTAIIALGLIAISLGICSVFLIKGPSQSGVEIPLPVFSDTPTAPAKKGNIVEILVLIAILSLIMGLIVYSARKDRLAKAAEVKKAGTSPIFSQDDELGNLEIDSPETNETDDDESFDIGLD